MAYSVRTRQLRPKQFVMSYVLCLTWFNSNGSFLFNRWDNTRTQQNKVNTSQIKTSQPKHRPNEKLNFDYKQLQILVDIHSSRNYLKFLFIYQEITSKDRLIYHHPSFTNQVNKIYTTAQKGVHCPPETSGFPNPILSKGIWWYAISTTAHTSPYETNPTAVAPRSTQSADSPSHLICSFARVDLHTCTSRHVSVPWTLPRAQTTRSPTTLARPRMAGPGSDGQ